MGAVASAMHTLYESGAVPAVMVMVMLPLVWLAAEAAVKPSSVSASEPRCEPGVVRRPDHAGECRGVGGLLHLGGGA